MVRPGACRGNDDLDPVKYRTGRVENHVVTASSHGVRGRHCTSDIPSTLALFGSSIYYVPGAPGSSTQPLQIPFRTRPPPPSNRPYTPIPYDSYGSSQAPPTSYDPYAHAPTPPLRMPGHDWPHCRSKTQVSLNEVSGPRLQLGTQLFENLVSSVSVDSSHSAVEYEAIDSGNPSSEYVFCRDSVMSKIAESRPKRPEKSRPPTIPTQRKKAKNDSWEQTGPADGGRLDPVLIPSYSGHIVGKDKHIKSVFPLRVTDGSLVTDKNGNIVPAKL
ncbi:hypothetical protein M9H77_11300 [Catharanthus roseus]|uniref:Uncharacterized protein n=1 Tax=Catharanthus roseus TaxID=4058 RepID=A0ACC0BE64_CATRO|nr:hypothetical protein M9H77_11300 [Catharanthus roseus]